MCTYLEQINVPAIINTASSNEVKITILPTIIQLGLNYVLPLILKTKSVYLMGLPSISRVLNNLIKKRQRALSEGDSDKFRAIRNQVNYERKICPSKY